MAAIVFEGSGSSSGFLLLIPAGALMLVRAVLMLSRPDTVLRPLADIEARSVRGRTGFRIEHRFGAVLLLVIAVGWIAMGVVEGL